MLAFTVYGNPQPQGSMKAFVRRGRAMVTSDNTKLKPWRQEVACTAAYELGKISQSRVERPAAVIIEVDFYFERPKSTKRGVSKTTKPDIDKLLRALLDSLTGIAFDDDAQVTKCVVTKQFGTPARAEIKVRAEQRASE
jgi:crossover junction endodeoxyribonuclease RusA